MSSVFYNGISGFFSFPGSLPAGVTPSMDTVQVIVMQAFNLAFIVALIVTAVDTANMGYRLLKRLISETSTPMIPSAKA